MQLLKNAEKMQPPIIKKYNRNKKQLCWSFYKKIKWFLTIMLFVNFSVHAQKDSILIKESKALHYFLVTNNSAALHQKLNTALSYGHSNGWIETKKDVINNIATKCLVYNSIEVDSITQHIQGKTGYVRFVGNCDVIYKGTSNIFKLKVLEVWTKRKGKWQLLARQAVKA